MPSTRRQRMEPTTGSNCSCSVAFPSSAPTSCCVPSSSSGTRQLSARQTNTPERTLYRQAARFETDGMASLFAPVPTRQRRLPAEMRQALRQLTAEYPAFRPNEVATI